jgi:hypothetical protein
MPWAADEITQPPEGLSAWAWSSSLTTPTMIWDLPEVAILMCRDAAMFQHLRSVQSEILSEYFYCWHMTEYLSLPLTSDGSERTNAITSRILSAWAKKEDEQAAIEPNIMTDSSKPGVSLAEAGNAKEPGVVAGQ